MSEIVGVEPRATHVTPEQIFKEIEAVMLKYPQLACVTLIGLRSDASKLACHTNVSKQQTKDMLRHGMSRMNEGRIKIPFRE